MVDEFSSKGKPHPPSLPTDATTRRKHKKSDRVRDMATMLFAELFYRQVMEGHEAKRRRGKGRKIDS